MMLGDYNFTSQHVAASELILRSSLEVFPACLSLAHEQKVIRPDREPNFARGPILSVLRFVGCSSLVSEGILPQTILSLLYFIIYDSGLLMMPS